MKMPWAVSGWTNRISGSHLELVNISDIVENAGFKVFADVVKKGGIVKALECQRLHQFYTKRNR